MAEAIAQEMRVDERVFVMGEDIGPLGGVFGNTRGLYDEFGGEREAPKSLENPSNHT